ncbi:hypothetical protein BRAO375_1310020 [Bradyrhizobium sp. ORS 375]|nr:hypothetical protein BRAO375_1310020 [Bradyrhizobium sp. ORS 375]
MRPSSAADAFTFSSEAAVNAAAPPRTSRLVRDHSEFFVIMTSPAVTSSLFLFTELTTDRRPSGAGASAASPE